MKKYKVLSGFVMPDGKPAKVKSTVPLDEKFAKTLIHRNKVEPVDDKKAADEAKAEAKAKKEADAADKKAADEKAKANKK